LKSLCQSLILTRSAIQVYEYTSLGQSLANAVYPDVEQCHVVLQEMLDKIIHYRGSLHSTSISGLWRQVWWSGWDGDELASSIMELSACQESLNKFLMALNSYVLFPFHASEPADISRSIINTKCCVDGPWKWIAHESCIHWKVLCFVKATSTPSASHPNQQGTGSGSLGTEPTSADIILFNMEGNLYFVHVSVMSHISES